MAGNTEKDGLLGYQYNGQKYYKSATATACIACSVPSTQVYVKNIGCVAK